MNPESRRGVYSLGRVVPLRCGWICRPAGRSPVTS